MTVYIEGMREISTAFAKVGRDTARGMTLQLRAAAEPVRRDAEGLAVQRIPNIGSPWSKMRVGVSRSSVYVAPRKRGLKGRPNDPRRRPNLAPLLLERAMEPALERNEGSILAGTEDLLAHICADFNRGAIQP